MFCYFILININKLNVVLEHFCSVTELTAKQTLSLKQLIHKVFAK